MQKNQENKKTAVQFIKNTVMGFVVTIFESLSLTPFYRLFAFIVDETPRLFAANTVSIVIFFFVRFFINYFWVFHSKRNIIKILPLFAVLIAVFSVTTTWAIEGVTYLFNLSDALVNALGDDTVMFIAKMIATFIMGIVNFAICKKFIFTEDKK